MHNSYERLAQLLREAPEYTVEGELNKNIIAEQARKYDTGLINKLLADRCMKKLFFSDSNAGLIFKKDIFLQFVSQKEFLPDSYTAFEQEIGLASGGTILRNDERVVLNWPYKDCVLEGGQTKEDAKRDEVFFNEILAPDEINTIFEDKVFTNWKRYDKDGEHELNELKPNDNLVIRGNNLVVLHSLKKRFAEKIQLIYIDPPYNTANDSFGYNDNFKRSTWLTFMKNRLSVAKDLLKSTGVMAISINYKEMSYLKVLCDELFGEQNYISTITVKTATTASFRAINDCPVNVSEFILIYAKNKTVTRINPVYVASRYSEDYGSYIENIDKPCSEWVIIPVDNIIYKNEGVNNWQEYKKKHGSQWKEDRYNKKAKFCMEHSNRIVSLNTMQKPSRDIAEIIEKSKKDKGKIYQIGKNFIYNGRSLAFFSKKLREIDGEIVPTEILTNIWTDISFLSLGTEGGVDLPNGKKPEKLVKRLIDLYANQDDIILDYHLGSGTTCAVAHKMGIQYIGIEQLDYGKNDPIVRLRNVVDGNNTGVSRNVDRPDDGSFVYCNVKNDANEFREKVQIADDEKMNDLLNEVLRSSFLSYRIDARNHHIKLGDFYKLSLTDKKHVLLDLIDNNTLYLNYSEIGDAAYKISDEDKKHNKAFYGE